MLFFFNVFALTLGDFKDEHITIKSEDRLKRTYEEIEEKLGQISKIDSEILSLHKIREKDFVHHRGDELKPIALTGIRKDRTIEYENFLNLLPIFNSEKLNSPYASSRAPILSYQLIGKPNARTFASQIKVSFPIKSQCNIRQAVFLFKNKTQNDITVSYMTQPIDFPNAQNLVKTIDLETEAEFSEIDVDILLNWGDQKRTCLPDIEVIGPIH